MQAIRVNASNQLTNWKLFMRRYFFEQKPELIFNRRGWSSAYQLAAHYFFLTEAPLGRRAQTRLPATASRANDRIALRPNQPGRLFNAALRPTNNKKSAAKRNETPPPRS